MQTTRRLQTGLDRRSLLAGSASGLAALAAGVGYPADPANARARSAITDAPGFLRRKIGDVEVVSLLDGEVAFPVLEFAKFFDGASPEAIAPLNDKARMPAGGFPLLVSAFLVRSGDRLILIDTGAADKFQPPHFGKVPAAIKAAGYQLSDVDTVLVTHMHGDHVGGLVDGAGNALYPNAELVMSDVEHRFWTDDSNAARVAEVQKPFFALSKAVLAPYAKQIRLFSGTAEVAPGIVPVPLPGHTPGHTGFLINSGPGQLLVWGDALHVAAWQFDRPEWRMAFDIDAEAGVATRLRVLDMASAERLLVGGMHLPFPSFAHVAREGSAYRYITAL